MAVAYDTFSASTRTATTDPYTFTHTPVGTPRGIFLFCLNITSATDRYVTASYGGVQMEGYIIRAVDAAGEPGDCVIFFLGSQVKSGAQTVSVDLSSATTDDIQFYCVSMTGNTDLRWVSAKQQGGDAANPSQTTINLGLTCLTVGAIYSGLAAPASLTPNANMTAVSSVDHGNSVTRCDRQTTVGTGDFVFSYTSAIDDVAMAVASATEVTLPASGGIPQIVMPPMFPPERRVF